MFILSVVFTTMLVSVSGSDLAQRRIDSLGVLLEGQQGAARLKTLSLMYEYSTDLNSLEGELAVLYPYLGEARRQNDDKETGYALVQRLCAFYNYDREDSLFHYYPESIAWFEERNQWYNYYFAALLNVQSYIYINRPVMAMTSARQMYRDAHVLDDDYGKGVTAYLLGYVQFTGDNNTEALRYMKEAVRWLDKEDDLTILFKAYDKLWEIYCDEERYDEALETLKKWEKIIKARLAEIEETGEYFSVRNYFFYCWCGMAEVYSRKRMFPEARTYLAKADEEFVDKPVYSYFINNAKSVYFEEKGDWESAVSWYRKAYPEDGNFSSVHAGFESSERFARLLARAGYNQEAVGMYEKAVEFASGMKSMELQAQMDDLERLYEIDRMRSSNRNIQIMAAVIIFALLTVFTVYFVFYCRLRSKNRALSEQLREVNRLRNWQLAHLAQGEEVEVREEDDGSHRKNEELVWLACRKIVEDRRFRNPSLNRKQLADLLGTNENYLASAIRDVNDGQTVGDFINGFRLDYACRLITESPGMTLEAVAHESGLVTRSTLFRLFLKKFGMSPSQYRLEQIKDRKSV